MRRLAITRLQRCTTAAVIGATATATADTTIEIEGMMTADTVAATIGADSESRGYSG